MFRSPKQNHTGAVEQSSDYAEINHLWFHYISLDNNCCDSTAILSLRETRRLHERSKQWISPSWITASIKIPFEQNTIWTKYQEKDQKWRTVPGGGLSLNTINLQGIQQLGGIFCEALYHETNIKILK